MIAIGAAGRDARPPRRLPAARDPGGRPVRRSVSRSVIVGFLAPQRSEASRARRATDRAQEIMGGRAEIAAMIAHEVRGPVSTVRGLAGTALSHYDRLDDDERRELLGLIEQESRRLLATVDASVHGTEGRRGHASPTTSGRRGSERPSVRASPPPTSASTRSSWMRRTRRSPRPEVDHRGRPPAGGQRGEVLAAGRPDPRERPGRGRRGDDRRDRRRTGYPRRAPRRRVRQVPELASRRVRTGGRAPARASSSSAASCSPIGETCTSSTAPGGGTMLRVRIPMEG